MNKATTSSSPSAPVSETERARLEETIEFCEEALKLSPNDTETLQILREAYLRLGRQNETLATRRRIARAYLNLGLPATAAATCEAILEGSPGDPDTVSLLRETRGNPAPPAS